MHPNAFFHPISSLVQAKQRTKDKSLKEHLKSTEIILINNLTSADLSVFPVLILIILKFI